MSNAINSVIAFTIGAAVGTVVTGVFLKKKYEQIANKEIEEVRAYYSEKEKISEEYNKLANVYNSDIQRKGEEATKEPYVIEPESLGEDNYEIECLTYYSDGILADSDGNVVEDVDGTVGADFFTHFGEYEDDSVHIRNERYNTDYEILKDLRMFTEVPQFQK